MFWQTKYKQKHNPLNKKKNALPETREAKVESYYIGGAATIKEKKKEEERVRRCTKHFV